MAFAKLSTVVSFTSTFLSSLTFPRVRKGTDMTQEMTDIVKPALLIVDDDGELRSMLRDYLRAGGVGPDGEDPAPLYTARDLLACVKSMLRRSADTTDSIGGHLQWGPLRIDFRHRRAQAAGQDLQLTAAELRILEQLMRADARPVTRSILTSKALGRRLLPTDRSLDTHISNLRRKIQRATSAVALKSVRGTGYALALTDAPRAAKLAELPMPPETLASATAESFSMPLR
jgi:DNA-binding winged helix-turn-helix (wHTH) protein